MSEVLPQADGSYIVTVTHGLNSHWGLPGTSPLESHYVLNPDLTVRSAELGYNYVRVHATLERLGKLDHSAEADEKNLLPVRRWNGHSLMEDSGSRQLRTGRMSPER